MPILQLIPFAAEEGAGVAPFVIGGGMLLVLTLAMLALLAFGKGREHS